MLNIRLSQDLNLHLKKESFLYANLTPSYERLKMDMSLTDPC